MIPTARHIPNRPFRSLARWIGLSLLVVFTTLANANGADSGRAKRVVMISTGSRFSPGFALIEQSALDTMAKLGPGRIDFYSEHLDIIRFPSESYQRIFRDYLREKYADNPPDLLMLFYVGNLGIAAPLLQQLFPEVPVVVAGFTEEKFATDRLGSLVSGFAQHVDPRTTIEMILRLQPETRRIVIIGGTAEVDRLVLDRAEKDARSFAGRVEFDLWNERPLAEIRKSVTSLPARTVLLFTGMYRDAAGETFIPARAARLIAESAKVPLYVLSDAQVGVGSVGGFVVDVGMMGKRAGELANRILGGAAPASRPFESRSDGVPMFDWRALKRWEISESRLPPGSVVRFRERTLWEQYRWYVIGALAIIAIQAVLIADLLLQHARRRRSETDLRRNREQLAHVTRISTMGELAASLAHELNQPLTAILSNAQAAQRFINAKPTDLKEVREILEDIVRDNRRAGAVIHRMRALVKKEELEFAPINIASVIGDVVQLVHSDGILRGIRVDIECQDGLPSVRGDGVQLQQVVLNLLINAFDAMKEATTKEPNVKVRAKTTGEGTVEISVRDHGSGLTSDKLAQIFQPFYTTKRDGLGMGLPISRSIIEAHGGRLWAESNLDLGATFHFTLPVIDGEAAFAATADR
jgi:signal transduction histidine kinase